MELPVSRPEHTHAHTHTHGKRKHPLTFSFMRVIWKVGCQASLSACFLTAGSRSGSPGRLVRRRNASPDPRVCRETPRLVFTNVSCKYRHGGKNGKYLWWNVYVYMFLFLCCWCHIIKFFSLCFLLALHSQYPSLLQDASKARRLSAKKQTAQSGGGVWGWSLVLCVESLQDILFQHLSQLSAVCTVCSHQWAHWTETKAWLTSSGSQCQVQIWPSSQIWHTYIIF